jgi:hypothetical protein
MKKIFLSALIFFLLSGCSIAAQETTPVFIPTRTSPPPIPTNTSTPPLSGERIPVVLLQDGAPDDITAAMYLMLDLNVNLAGIVISNGPGDPKKCAKTAMCVRELVDDGVPVMGICWPPLPILRKRF